MQQPTVKPTYRYEERKETVALSEHLKHVTDQHPFALLTTGVGSGKTFVAIRMAYLYDPNAFLLVIAPKSKIEEHSWEPSVEAFNRTMNSDLTIYSTNYDQLQAKDGPKNISDQLEQACDENRTVILIYDEAHVIKLSPDGTISKTAKLAIQLSQTNVIDHTIGATGTPLANSYVDYGTYFVMAGFYTSKSKYLKEQVIQWDQYFAPVVKNPVTGKIDRNLFWEPDKIDAMQNSITVYDETEGLLPPYKEHWVPFTMSNDESLAFVDEELADEFTHNEAKERTYLGHYKHVKQMVRNGGYFEFPVTGITRMRRYMAKDPERLKQAARILYNKLYTKNPHPVLIFYLNNAEKEVLEELLTTNQHFQHVHLRYVNGDQKDPLIPDHQETVYLIQYKAGSAAIEIPEAKTTIFYMPTYSYADFKQAKGRNRRNLKSDRNTSDTIHYYYLSATNTLDERIWDAVSNKRDFSNKALRSWINSQKGDFMNGISIS